MFNKIPDELKQQFQEERFLKTKETLFFVAVFIACPEFIFFWYQDLIIRPNYKWECLLIRLSTVIATIVSIKLYKFSFFKKNYNIPYFLFFLHASFIFEILFLKFDFPGNNPHLYFTCTILFILAIGLFMPIPLFYTIFLHSAILSPYIFLIFNNLKNLSIHQYINNINATLASLILIYIFRYFQIKNIESDFMQRMSLSANAQIGEKIAHIVHDIRSPLQALKLVESESKQQEGEIKNLLNIALNRIIMMCEEIMHSRQALFISNQKITTDEFANELKNECTLLSRSTVINFKANLLSTEKTILIDKPKILRLLGNFINNSLKATRSSKIPQISVNLELTSDLKISVEDNGVGIKNTTKIFNSGYSESGSTGLGLAFCKSVVDYYQGKIEVESKPGNTKFTITIPFSSIS